MEHVGELTSGLVSPGYVSQGIGSLHGRIRGVRQLFSERRVPEEGWSEEDVELLVRELSKMDSNNFAGAIGAGEREGRVICPMVRRRWFGLAHGVGRSGDVAAEQPKAAGSSLLAAITRHMALDYVRDVCGMRSIRAALVLPLATSMSLALTLSTLKSTRPPSANIVIWPRIDQKACFKAILSAGCTPKIVQLSKKELLPHGGGEGGGGEGGEDREIGSSAGSWYLECDVKEVEKAVLEVGVEKVVAVMSTSSCFAPRNCDPVVAIGKLCKSLDIPHVVNHAYGLTAKKLCNKVDAAAREFRMDACVCSTDKNLLTPVGGALVLSGNGELLDRVASSYAGRASCAATLDTFLSLLNVGKRKYRELLEERDLAHSSLLHSLRTTFPPHSILSPPSNPISIALLLPQALQHTHPHLPPPTPAQATALGSLLFARGVSGARVVVGNEDGGGESGGGGGEGEGGEDGDEKGGGVVVKDIGGHEFVAWGAHTTLPSPSYITFAAALGLSRDDVPILMKRFLKAWKAWTKGLEKKGAKEEE